MEHKDAILQAYRELALEKNKLPFSVQEICDRAGVERHHFHRHFADLEELANAPWKEWFLQTIRSIEGADVYTEYSVREKLLAFYFTFLEVLNEDKAFVDLFREFFGIWSYDPACTKEMKPLFLAFLTELVEEGRGSGEIEERYVIGDGYADWHWPQFLYLLNFWWRDKTKSRERTDQAVEKAVNLGFDLMGHNVLDSAFDFARFVFSRSGKGN